MSYDKVMRAAASMPWMLAEEKLAEIEAMLQVRLNGPVPISAEDRERYAAAQAPRVAGGGGVGVLPVYGVLSQRMNLMAETSGGTSTEQLATALRQLVADPQVAAIVLDVDSPGGNVYGIDELATEIRRARGQKPIVAVANSFMASAAYYLGSAANEIVVTPGGEVGSLGVFSLHLDVSEAEAAAGVRPTLIKAGKFKAEHSEHFPLTDEARSHIEEDVARYYEMFLAAVATGRGVSVEAVRNGFGEGRVVGAKEAVRLGMADKVATLQDTIARMQTPAGRGAIMRRGAVAEAEALALGDLSPEDKAAWLASGRESFRAESAEAPAGDPGEVDARLRRLRI